MFDYNVVKKGFDIKTLPVTLEVIKKFSRINNDAQDDLLLKLNVIATQQAENYTQKSFLKNKFLLSFNGRYLRKVKLPFKLIININNIKIINIRTRVEIVLRKNIDYSWQEGSDEVFFLRRWFYFSRTEILYEAGLLDPGLVPSQVTEGILKHIYLIYNGLANKDSSAELNHLYSTYKELRIVI